MERYGLEAWRGVKHVQGFVCSISAVGSIEAVLVKDEFF